MNSWFIRTQENIFRFPVFLLHSPKTTVIFAYLLQEKTQMSIINKATSIGVITFWTLKDTQMSHLREAFGAAGIGDFCPAPVTPMRALKMALSAIYGDHLIRQLAGNGYAVVTEQRGDEDNQYVTTRVVHLDERDEVVLNESDEDDQQIMDGYQSHREVISASALGGVLAKLVTGITSATPLRPTGGIYWFAGEHLAKWENICNAVEKAGKDSGVENRLYIVRHDLDNDSIRAVRDCLIADVQRAAKILSDQIADGDIGERGLSSKEREARELAKKVKDYETILGGGVESLLKVLENVETSAATAILTLSGITEKQPAAV
jgi:hypothetical protein